MAPELTNSPKPIYSSEVDVYSFGVIVLEIMTKWTAVSDYPIHEIWDCWRRNAQHEMIDSYKLDDCSEEEALQYMLIGLLCVQDDRRKRPDMKTVVQMLCGKSPLPEPSYPGYYPKEPLPEKRTWFSRILKV